MLYVSQQCAGTSTQTARDALAPIVERAIGGGAAALLSVYYTQEHAVHDGDARRDDIVYETRADEQSGVDAAVAAAERVFRELAPAGAAFLK